MKTYLVDFDFQILLSSISVLVLGTFILSRIVRKELAAVLMFVKLLIFICYFCFFADGTWFYGGDDWGFFERGLILAQAEPNILKIWSHPEGFYLRHGHSLSLMYFHNYIAILLFGEHYFAPVLLNILLTSGVVTVLAAILRRQETPPGYIQGFVIFASLHWTMLAWSSFLNLKEITVSLLLVCVIYYAHQAARLRVIPLGMTLLIFYLFLRIRFYFPVLIVLGSAVAWAPKFRSSIKEYRWFIMTAFILLLALLLFKSSWIRLFFQHVDLLGTPYGVIHFVLQPAPWKITEPASYLALPSVLHWLVFPAAAVGAWLMWKQGAEMRTMVGVLLIGILFYGMVPAIASTRHRVPLDIILIVAQYQFIWRFGISRLLESSAKNFQS